MKKLTVLFITLLFLSACTPSEADFKSTVQPTARDDVALAANAMQAIDKLMDEPEKEVKEEKSEVDQVLLEKLKNLLTLPWIN